MIRNILAIFVKLANDNNLTYWIDSSSLVAGAYGINPLHGQENVNLCINIADEYDFLDLRFELEQYKLHIQAHEGGYKVLPVLEFKSTYEDDKFSQRIEGDNLSGNEVPAINILMVIESGGRTKYRHNYFNTRWPNHYHMVKDLYPLKQYILHGIRISGPKNPLPYIKRAYKR